MAVVLNGPSKGDRVTLRYDEDSSGVVTAAGPEVCEVRFDDKVTRCISNKHLRSSAKL
jgi:hypothetical protein